MGRTSLRCWFVSPFSSVGFVDGLALPSHDFLSFSECDPEINQFFNRMQVPSSIVLALSHGSNDVQKSIGLIAMTFVILGFSTGFHAPLWVIASCGYSHSTWNGQRGWKIIKSMGSKIYRLRSFHAFCAQTSSGAVILGGPRISPGGSLKIEVFLSRLTKEKNFSQVILVFLLIYYGVIRIIPKFRPFIRAPVRVIPFFLVSVRSGRR